MTAPARELAPSDLRAPGAIVVPIYLTKLLIRIWTARRTRREYQTITITL